MTLLSSVVFHGSDARPCAERFRPLRHNSRLFSGPVPMLIASSLTQLVAPWAKLYSDSKLVSTGVTFAHIGGLLLGGGCAIAGDRMSLRFNSIDQTCQQNHLDELSALHRPVLVGLGITMLSGLLLLASDLKTFLPSIVFWSKMGLIILLLLNGLQLQRAETAMRVRGDRSERAWRRLRRVAKFSIALWFGVTLLGVALLSV